MSIKFFSKLLITGLVVSYPLLMHWALPLWPDLPKAALTMLPAFLNGWLAWIFGCTLRQGREPLVSTFARMERGQLLNLAQPDLQPDMTRYTRRLTQIWSVLFIAMALLSALLSLSAQLEWWVLFTGVISYGLVGSLYLGEYLYRRCHFLHYPHANPFKLAWFLIKSGPLWIHRAR